MSCELMCLMLLRGYVILQVGVLYENQFWFDKM